ncbi:hypothetical protein AAKU52_000980 [Pedobacter sp. CG_S7]|uniref:hypothetical protein n=1 Tax=Pedobacter sp. CG_S7 TaxID=3143930 RepID=UPI0033976617
MHDFLLTSAEKDLDFYHKMLIEVLCVVSECNVILNINDGEVNKLMIFKGITDLNTLYNDFIDGVNLND